MELTLISESKLKVRLSREELTDFELTCDTIDYDNTETKRALWSILNEAKHKTGFDPAKERLYIRVYPQTDGGCDMLVTKLCDKKSFADSKPSSELKEKPSIPENSSAADADNQKTDEENTDRLISAATSLYPVQKIHMEVQIYIFTAMSEMLLACHKLISSGIKAPVKSSAYYDMDTKQYLMTMTLYGTDESLLKYSLISEYGRKISTENIDLEDERYYSICSENAVDTLSCFALDVQIPKKASGSWL